VLPFTNHEKLFFGDAAAALREKSDAALCDELRL
jgi:hypothetical protein